MKRYLFLLAWVQDSESASGDNTNVNEPGDLYPEYQKGNEHVFAVSVDAPNQKVALAFGTERAFHDNYTGYDTVSDCVEVADDFHDPNILHIVVDLTPET